MAGHHDQITLAFFGGIDDRLPRLTAFNLDRLQVDTGFTGSLARKIEVVIDFFLESFALLIRYGDDNTFGDEIVKVRTHR